MNPIDTVWTEKYRPNKVSNMVGDFKDKILKYLGNQATIPHFLFHSKTPGTGKCLTGDEIFLSSKGLTSFKDYCDNNNITEEYTDIVEELYDPQVGKVKSEYFYKSQSEVIKIKTKRGHTIRGTPNHKIKVFDKYDGIVWKKLLDIKKDDIIPIVYNTQIFGNNIEFDYSKLRDKNKRDHSSIDIKKPKQLNKDIAYFLGVFTANGLFDGNSVNISTKKDYIYDELSMTIHTEFGLEVGEHKKEQAVFRCGGTRLKDFMVDVCGCSKHTARDKFIPKIILGASKEIQMEFIDGLFEDSWISDEGYIEYSTASEQLAKELKIMMLNLGFFTTHRTKYIEQYEHHYHILTLPVEHSKKYIEYFKGLYKNEYVEFKDNMNTNILSYKSIIKDFIKNKRREHNISRYIVKSKDLAKINNLNSSIQNHKNNLIEFMEQEEYLSQLSFFIDNDVFLDEVCEIEKQDEQYIYDFHIPETHAFLANGIINHNTTLAKAIINELECDALILNSSDDRKIETVREKVKEFAVTKSSKEGMRRCVFLDEFDGMLKASQEALRNVMETYSKNVFFILTCNNINKVIDPLKSRCITIHFAYPKKEEVYTYLEKIVDAEKMDYTEEGLKTLVELNYPSIRNCVIALQDLHTEGKQVTQENVKPVNEIYDKLWEAIQKKDWKTVKVEVMQSTIDPRELNIHFWTKALESEMTKMIQITCRNERDIALGADPKVIFATSLIEMTK